MRIILQFPEGLKTKALEEAAKRESGGHEVFVACAPCYGACDLCLDEARHVKAEKLIHYGHAEFMVVKSDIEIEYRPYFLDVDWKVVGKVLAKTGKLLKDAGAKSVALTFPVQHLENSKRVKKELEALGFTVVLGMGGKHIRHAGQVLGCDSESVANAGSVDAVVYFGGGKFHPTGIPSGKPIICADPHLGDAYDITGEILRVEKKRKGSLLAASQAKKFGILVSTKNGQINMTGARLAKKLLEKKGRKAMLLVANELAPISLANFMTFDAYINTACPRINDDTEAYGKPIVNVADMKRLLELMV
ncbi:MAG: diphthamide biosynthesis enzyme Dph2 [Candidatus Micrarchaeia archaeon]